MATSSGIFISYSHDSDAHRAFVLALANRLRADGLDCQIDQYVKGFPAEGWQRWMENSIEQAAFVLIVCTPLYMQRYRGQDPHGGRGVNFEGVVISQTLYDAYYRNTKFIPVIPEGGSLGDVPLPLKGYSTYTLPSDYTALYRLLTDQHATPAPELGERVVCGETETLQRKSPSIPLLQRGKQDGSDTLLKAVYIGVMAALSVALLAGLIAVFGKPTMSTQGDCSGIITGDINGTVTQNCTKEAE